MRDRCTIVLVVLSLIQSGCGTQAGRAVAQAALFTAIEVAGAAMQATADRAAERDAEQRARLRATATGNWSLVRAANDDEVDSECERAEAASRLDCQAPDNSDHDVQADSTAPSATAEEPVNIGGCMVCE